MNLRRILAISSISVFAAAALVAPSLAAGNPNCTATDGDYIVTFTKGAVVSNEVKNVNGKQVNPKFMYDAAINGFAGFLTGDQVCVLQKRGNVLDVEADQKVSIDVDQSGATWGIARIDEQVRSSSSIYSYSSTGSGINAYVIDTGILATHNEFSGRVSQGFTAINDTNGTSDCKGHGTHVSGTIGGVTYGVAKAVNLIPVRVLDCTGSGSISGVIAGVDWATTNHLSGVKAVANMSLGGGASSSLDAAVNSLINDGVTVVVAAGNSKFDACKSSPARVPAAITVAASDNNDVFASFSNRGKCVDIIAPGVAITSSINTTDSAIDIYSGTSMASPHVAGVAARILQMNPNFTPAQVAAAIINTSTPNKVSSVPTGTPNRLLYIAPGK
jgi:subtilisin family serine protease